MPGSLLSTLALSMVLLLESGSAVAQDADQSLRDENAALRARVRALETELEQARAEIAALEATVTRLRRGSVPPPPPTPEVTIDESEPSASPRAVLRAAQAAYREAAQQLDGPGSDDWRQQERELRDWAEATSRSLQAKVTWHVLPRPNATARRVGRFTHLPVLAVDPVTATPLGSLTLVLDRGGRGALRDIEESLGPAFARTPLIVQGRLKPALQLNPRRTEPGPFNRPPLVGPYVELQVVLEADRVRAAPDPSGHVEQDA